jgi:hypothetical protein
MSILELLGSITLVILVLIAIGWTIGFVKVDAKVEMKKDV